MFSVSRIINNQSMAATARGFHATAAASAELTRGVVKWFNVQKGFGFITPEGAEEDVFVHHSQVRADGFRTLADGEPVEFTMETDPKTGKIHAVNVTGPDGAPCKGRPRDLAPRPRREPRSFNRDGEFRSRRDFDYE